MRIRSISISLSSPKMTVNVDHVDAGPVSVPIEWSDATGALPPAWFAHLQVVLAEPATTPVP